MQINSAKDLDVYKRAYRLALDVFFFTEEWPREERYALTDQIRRSIRSVCANLKEAWAKRRYEAHFVSKLTDSDGENAETEAWLDFAHDCKYITFNDYEKFKEECRGIGSMLGAMIKNPKPFLIKKTTL